MHFHEHPSSTNDNIDMMCVLGRVNPGDVKINILRQFHKHKVPLQAEEILLIRYLIFVEYKNDFSG